MKTEVKYFVYGFRDDYLCARIVKKSALGACRQAMITRGYTVYSRRLA
jgi:hypothetical protein